jgi:tetratricopeptide (TPR) repeat protein
MAKLRSLLHRSYVRITVRQRWTGCFAAIILCVGCTNALAGEAPQAAAPSAIVDGASALVRGDAAEAVTGFTAALADTSLSNDRRAAYLNDRAVAYGKLGQVKLAVEDFNAAAQLFPEYAAVYNNRGTLLLTLGLPKEALKDFDRAIVLAPGYAAAFNNRAGAFVKLAQYQDAIRDYTKAVELMPTSPAPLASRGRVHLSMMRPHAATRDFSRAVSIDARYSQGYRSRAEAKLATGNYEEAVEDLSRALAFEAGNAEFYRVRGQAYLALRNVPSAIKDFTQAIEINPQMVEAYEGRGLSHGLVEAYDEANADLNKAIEIDPRSAAAFAIRAYVYKLNGQIEIAAKDLETAQKLGPDKPEVLWALAEVQEAQGLTAVAIQNFKKALAQRPGYGDALDGLRRLAGPNAEAEESIVQGAGVALWRVVNRGGRYFAVNDEYTGLSVPLEVVGDGKPKLMSWEIKPPPARGIGVLRFSSGPVKGKSGSEELELVALVDFEGSKVIAIVPDKQGGKSSAWTWEADRVTVAAIDGLNDEFQIRRSPSETGIAAGVGAAGLGAAVASSRRYSTGRAAEKWAPWNEPMAGGSSAQSNRPQRNSAAPKKKAKTLFDLLFN